MNRRREEILKRYLDGIQGCAKVKSGIPYKLKDSSHWMFVVRVEERDKFIVHMKERGVSTGVHYMPLTLHPLFKKYESDTPVAEKIWREFVTLPLHVDLTNEEIDFVIDSMWDFTVGDTKI